MSILWEIGVLSNVYDDIAVFGYYRGEFIVVCMSFMIVCMFVMKRLGMILLIMKYMSMKLLYFDKLII